MGLGHNDLLGRFAHITLYKYGVKSNITMIAQVCDRESRRDSWFENHLFFFFLFFLKKFYIDTDFKWQVYVAGCVG